ncbi:MAG: glycosyltransferase, partial [Clostridia bacterium]|nr:glycosyltransferase [Clostridia bacterium]
MAQELDRARARRLVRRVLKFGVVGVINTAVDFGGFFAFVAVAGNRTAWTLTAAQALSVALAATVSYLLNSRWTWRGSVPRPIPFAIVTMSTVALSSAVVPIVAAPLASLPIPWALVAIGSKVGAAVVTATLNFLGYHYWAFPEPVAVTIVEPSSPRADWTLILPAYNESARLPATLMALDEARADLFSDAEVIIADDGSSDATWDIIREAARERPWLGAVRLSRHMGKGAALRQALALSRHDRVVCTDADLSFDMNDIVAVADALHRFDVVAGARADGSPARIGRRFVHWTFQRILKVLGLGAAPDPQCGLKGFRRPAIDALLPRCRIAGFAFDAEALLVARLNGFRIGVHPVSRWVDRPGSRVRPLRDGWQTLAAAVVIVLRRLSGAYGPRPSGSVARSIVMVVGVVLAAAGIWFRIHLANGPAPGAIGSVGRVAPLGPGGAAWASGAVGAALPALIWAATAATVGFWAVRRQGGLPTSLALVVLTALHPLMVSILASGDIWTSPPALLVPLALVAADLRAGWLVFASSAALLALPASSWLPGLILCACVAAGGWAGGKEG